MGPSRLRGEEALKAIFHGASWIRVENDPSI
jgi:hypothetical protein